MEALKAVGNVSKKKNRKKSDADVAIKIIQRLYAIEHLAKNQGLSPEQLVEKRQSEAKPLLEEFKEWLLVKSEQVLPKTLLGKAISYTLGQWPRRIVYLGHACLTPDNNLAENSIRPFVVGRKNWLFYGFYRKVFNFYQPLLCFMILRKEQMNPERLKGCHFPKCIVLQAV